MKVYMVVAVIPTGNYEGKHDLVGIFANKLTADMVSDSCKFHSHVIEAEIGKQYPVNNNDKLYYKDEKTLVYIYD